MPNEQTTHDVRQERKAILLVEDDERDVILFREAFSSAGLSHSILAVSNGIEATDYLDGEGRYSDRSKYPYPAILLLDLKMPKMDGFEMLAWLYTRNDLEDIWVLVLSSSDLQTDVQMAMQLHADGYLVKPRLPEDWGNLVKELTTKWLSGESNESQPVG